MTLHDTLFIVVVDADNSPIGYISRGDLTRAQRDKIADDTIIEKGLWAKLFGK